MKSAYGFWLLLEPTLRDSRGAPLRPLGDAGPSTAATPPGRSSMSAAYRALEGALDLAGRALRALSEWRRRRALRSELIALDDRLLADIGLRREEIDAVVRGALPLRPEPEAPSRCDGGARPGQPPVAPARDDEDRLAA